jgi:hypothetical protein
MTLLLPLTEPHCGSVPPGAVVMVPAGQGLQAEAPASEKKPAGHWAVQVLSFTPARP